MSKRKVKCPECGRYVSADQLVRHLIEEHNFDSIEVRDAIIDIEADAMARDLIS